MYCWRRFRARTSSGVTSSALDGYSSRKLTATRSFGLAEAAASVLVEAEALDVEGAARDLAESVVELREEEEEDEDGFVRPPPLLLELDFRTAVVPVLPFVPDEDEEEEVAPALGNTSRPSSGSLAINSRSVDE